VTSVGCLAKTKDYLDLCKVMVSVFASLSAAVGLLLTGHSSVTKLPLLMAGVFLMGCGAGSLNHYQERSTDALMARTAARPLPSGKIDPIQALSLSLGLIGTGYMVLFFTGSLAAPFWGLMAVFWYNGFYTWYKTKSAFAAVPGAFVGAIPPIIGWVAGGGELCNPRLGVVCFLFFMWQVPHFLIHHLAFGKEYEKIGLPSLTAVFTKAQLSRLTFIWILAAAVSIQLFSLYGLVRSGPIRIALVAVSLWFTFKGASLLMGRGHPVYLHIFRCTNITMVAVILLLVTDRCYRYIG